MLPHHPQHQSAAPVAAPLAGGDTAAPASVPALAGPSGSATAPHQQQISESAATFAPSTSSTCGGPPSGVRDGAAASSSSAAAGSGPSPASGGSQQGALARADDAQAVAARSRHVGLGNGPRVNQAAGVDSEAGRRQDGSLPPQPRQQRSARQAQAAAAGSREGQSQSTAAALPAVIAPSSATAGMFSGFDT